MEPNNKPELKLIFTDSKEPQMAEMLTSLKEEIEEFETPEISEKVKFMTSNFFDCCWFVHTLILKNGSMLPGSKQTTPKLTIL